eukprot:13664821-Alexandrium_andersonii.AAC.1
METEASPAPAMGSEIRRASEGTIPADRLCRGWRERDAGAAGYARGCGGGIQCSCGACPTRETHAAGN